MDIKEEGTVTSILYINSEIWAGTSDGTLVMVDVKVINIVNILVDHLLIYLLDDSSSE